MDEPLERAVATEGDKNSQVKGQRNYAILFGLFLLPILYNSFKFLGGNEQLLPFFIQWKF